MLLIAALLLFLCGLMHSILGQRNLIRPLLERTDFPIVLGSRRNGRLTLWFGWHALTLVWWTQAAQLAAMAIDMGYAAMASLGAISAASAAVGLASLVVSKGKHLAWVLLLPLALISAIQLWSIGG